MKCSKSLALTALSLQYLHLPNAFALSQAGQSDQPSQPGQIGQPDQSIQPGQPGLPPIIDSANLDAQIYQSSQGTYKQGIQARNSHQHLRVMLQKLVCGNTKCPYSKDFFLDLLVDYGCNCYPASSLSVTAIDTSKSWYHMEFNGKPVDRVDEACLDTYHAYKCMFIDHENGDLQQGGQQGCYKGQTFNWYVDANNELQCGVPTNPDYINTINKDGCRLAACKIEKEFATKVASIIGSDPAAWKASNQSNYGSCAGKMNPGGTGQGGERDSCCGQYPSRTPFNSIVSQCCSDNSIVPFGNC